MSLQVELLAPDAADDAVLTDRVAGIINHAYAIGERGLRAEGVPRTTPDEIAARIRRGEMLAATVDGRVVGCGAAWPLDAATAEIGLVATDPEQWGGGVGGEIVRTAEELMRSRGVATAQLEVLVPQDGEHPGKSRLQAWYERLGYRFVRTASYEEVVGDALSHHTSTPCKFVVLAKSLA